MLVVVLLTRSDEGLALGVAVFGLAVLTDYFDGYFARRRNQVTKLGILLASAVSAAIGLTWLFVAATSPGATRA